MSKELKWKDVKEGQRLLIASRCTFDWEERPYSVTVCEIAKTAIQLMNESNGGLWWLVLGLQSDDVRIYEVLTSFEGEPGSRGSVM